MDMSKLNKLNRCTQDLQKTWCARDNPKNCDEFCEKLTPKGLKKIHELCIKHKQQVQMKNESEDRCQEMGRRRRPKENK